MEEAEDAATVHVWPDNLDAVNVFIAMSTQWRSAGFGATGLDYNALPVAFEMNGIKRSERPPIFESIRILEDAALRTMQLLAERERRRMKARSRG